MSRSTVINQMSTSVTGIFQLHDLLSISTMSGSINITVVPQPAASAKVPAELRLSTASGSIKVSMAPFLNDPSTVMPHRVFNSSLKSMSGSISAALVHNSQTSFSTMSGDIAASIYPLGQPGPMSYVGLSCMSGSASVVILPYVGSPQAGLRALSADFRGSSGYLKVRLPSTWEGEVSSNLSSGRVRYQWEGLRVLKDGSSFRAVKGNGLGKLNIQGNSMDVMLVAEKVPDEPVLPREEQSVVRPETEPVSVAPDMPALRREVEVQGEGLEDDDDWTLVGDEDGAEEATRRPPPSYDEAIRK